MHKQVALLKHLKNNNADVEERNINTILNKLGLDTEDKVYAFLNALKKIGYIEWSDKRPVKMWDHPAVIGWSPDKKSPIDYWAEITLTGLQYLREDKLKVYNKWTTIVAVIVAITTGSTGWYYSNAAKEKDHEIANLKKERDITIALQNARADSIRSLRDEVERINNSYTIKKHSVAIPSNTSLPINKKSRITGNK